MLNVDQKKRPRINEILKWPEIEKRIGIFLADDAYKVEFAHTVMHGLNIFAEFKKARPKKTETEVEHEEAELLQNNEDFNTKYKDFMSKIKKDFNEEESKKLLEEEVGGEVN